MEGLIEGRECGECTVCCSALPIDSEELRKLPGALCTHALPNKGCGIYETRPRVCRGFYCAWRFMEQLDESWRPDVSGLLIEFDVQGGRIIGVKIKAFDDLNVLATQRFVNLVASLIDAGMKVCLLYPQRGYFPARIDLNPVLDEPVRNRDSKAVVAGLGQVLRGFQNHRFVPVNFTPSADQAQA
jgi:hypothetical protein